MKFISSRLSFSLGYLFLRHSLGMRVALAMGTLVMAGPLGIGAPAGGHRLAPFAGTGVGGQAMLQACYQAFPIGGPCPVLPYQSILEVRGENDRHIATVRTDAQGLFRVPLRPGRYVLKPHVMVTLDVFGMINVTFPYDESIQVKVIQGRMTSVVVAYGKGF